MCAKLLVAQSMSIKRLVFSDPKETVTDIDA